MSGESSDTPDLKAAPWYVKAGLYVLEKHGVPLFFTLLLISWMVVQANWERQDRLAFQKVLAQMAEAIDRSTKAQQEMDGTIKGVDANLDDLQTDVHEVRTTLNIHAASCRR